MSRQPTFTPGDRVHLKGDPRPTRTKQVWEILTPVPGGSYRIHKVGRPVNIYTTMHAAPNNLTPIKESTNT
ncbi:hypothetical protein [Zhihengliuella flava]|uniref:Uncharacterized protein n=1 Tax=Zhihengliuella flava TaxID=1285193 RepID=A0A931GE91_9MICC|nr:hypothetical protein [Zhihengliuella flava]MBG6083267.1 hypothetical protein [Zhihengliuella flava]